MCSSYARYDTSTCFFLPECCCTSQKIDDPSQTGSLHAEATHQVFITPTFGNQFLHHNQNSGAKMRSIVVITYVAIALIALADAWNVAPTRSVSKSFVKRDPKEVHDTAGKAIESTELQSRRGVLRQGIGTLMIATASLTSSSSTLAKEAASLSPEKSKENEGLLSPSDVADLLRGIPTFAIVDKKGIPFTVVGEDAKVTGYFFTAYTEADRILQLAKKSADKAIAKAKADKEEDIGPNPWKNARVSTIPLDSAVTLVSKSLRMSGAGVYFKVAPAEDDIDDALAVTGDKDLAEGKVPLFYYEDFTIGDNGKQKTPLYFRKSELEKQWRLSNPKEDPPKTSVTELFSLITALLRPGGASEDFRNIVFVPPKESESKRKECIKKSGDEPPFVVGKRIIVL